MQFTDIGVVLKEKTTQDDRILTILTKEHGVLSAYAKGSKRIKGRNHSATEVCCYSSFVFYENRGRYSVDSAETEKIFFGIRQDVEKLSLANHFLHLCVQLAPEGEDASEYLRLLLNCLYFLDNGKRSIVFLKPVFELRLLALAGYMPDLTGCSECGNGEAESYFFRAGEGSIVCSSCYREGYGGIPLEPGVLAAMRHIIYSEPERIYSFQLGDGLLKELMSVVEQYLRIQLDTYLPALDYFHSVFLF